MNSLLIEEGQLIRAFFIVFIILLCSCNSDPVSNNQITKEEVKEVYEKEEEMRIIKHPTEPTIVEIPHEDHHTVNGWEVTFRDEFDQDHVSASKWNLLNTGYKAHGRLHHYLPEQVTSDSGVLKLEVSDSPYQSYPYRSGAVTTQGLHEQMYGKFEIRAKFPKGQGLFPAIWLLPTDHSSYPEIDIVEMLGQLPNELWHVAHQEEGNRAFHLNEQIDGSEWHTYTLDWSPDELIFYIDGEITFRTSNISHTSMYLLMNVTVGGTWVGDPNATTQFPAYMEVDYVRIYQK
ncbi:glycoside hydrolase family 16 protein [Psychrobacillus sp. FSL W7-1493]|uniref:glycoside hydrolase family 16 protein n=1 Tax=Psychrobacillus sp. FSL W7-1493 TaxID=2921552 RepID=UPI0030F96F38